MPVGRAYLSLSLCLMLVVAWVASVPGAALAEESWKKLPLIVKSSAREPVSLEEIRGGAIHYFAKVYPKGSAAHDAELQSFLRLDEGRVLAPGDSTLYPQVSKTAFVLKRDPHSFTAAEACDVDRMTRLVQKVRFTLISECRAHAKPTTWKYPAHDVEITYLSPSHKPSEFAEWQKWLKSVSPELPDATAIVLQHGFGFQLINAFGIKLEKFKVDALRGLDTLTAYHPYGAGQTIVSSYNLAAVKTLPSITSEEGGIQPLIESGIEGARFLVHALRTSP